MNGQFYLLVHSPSGLLLQSCCSRVVRTRITPIGETAVPKQWARRIDAVHQLCPLPLAYKGGMASSPSDRTFCN